MVGLIGQGVLATAQVEGKLLAMDLGTQGTGTPMIPR